VIAEAGKILAMRVAGRLAEIAVAVALVATGRPAIADPQAAPADPQAAPADPQAEKPDPQVEKADQLFAEARALMQSNLSEACKKFDESLRYNPAAIGTLLNVALCDEKLGRVASAVAKFTEARDRSREQGLPEHLRAAEDHLAVLVPQVPHLAIRLTQQLPETKVLVDDHVYALAALGDIPIDPGEHVVVVSAPDRLPHRATLVIAPAERKAIVIPVLDRAVTVTRSRRWIGQIATLTGGAAFGTSIGLSLYGLHLHNQQFDQGNCSHRGSLPDGCNGTGQSNNERARTYGNVATVVGGVGLAVAAAGAVIWYLAPRGSQTADTPPRVTLDVTADHLGVVAIGRF
jgi:tetratricopeptide (TPR) repeat protein